MTFDAIALPSLDGVPQRYVESKGTSFLRPLARALLDSDLVDANDITRRPTSEGVLCTRVLTRQWQDITAGLSLFDWHLTIDQDPYCSGRIWHGELGSDAANAWARIGTERGPISCRHVVIGGAVEYLEQLQRGFGQTILAALYDVLDMLPRVCTTVTTINLGQYIYWCGCSNEKDAVQEAMAMQGCATEKELRENHEFVSRGELFGPMPGWAARPRRRLPRRMIDRGAAPDRFAREVVDAMDELWTVLTFCGPFPDLRCEDFGAELVDFTLLIRWSESDSTIRIVDDYGQYSCEGDYVEAASVSGIDLSDRSFSRWLEGMRSTAKLARAAERVLAVLGSREYEEQRCLVRVLV